MSRGGRRAAVIGIAGLAVVAGGLAAIILGNAPRNEVSDASPRPTPSASSLSSASPTPSTIPRSLSPSPSAPEAWQFSRSSVLEAPGLDRTIAMTAWNDGFALISSQIRQAGDANVWVSDDGSQWSSTEPTGLETVAISSAYSTADGRLVALGYVPDGSLSGRFGARITSDARAWEPVDLGFPTFMGFRDLSVGPLG